MTPRSRPLTARQILRGLGSLGFEVIAIRGSHAKLRRTLLDGTSQTLTVPIHRAIAPGTVRAICRQASRFVPEAEVRRALLGED